MIECLERRNKQRFLMKLLIISNFYCSEKKCQSPGWIHLLSLLRWNWWACSLPLPIKDYSRAQASLQHLLAFSGTSHILQLQLHLGSPHSANRAKQGSSVSKQFIGAPGLGVYGGTRLWLLEMSMHLKRKAAGYMSQRLCDLLQRLYRHVAQVVWSRN